MSRFYGSITGQARTTATRRGGPASGISCHVRGWDVGCRAEMYDYNGQDRIRVFLTAGSNGNGPEKQKRLKE